MNPTTYTALIAEDEPLLALALQQELAQAWPALQIQAVVGDGASAVQQALALQPDVLFFDIRMPGMDGLEAAAELAEQWPSNGKPFPRLVFATAYDQYAVQAFEAQAVDYLLKPVQGTRLQKTVDKLQAQLAQPTPQGLDTTLDQLRALLAQPAASQAPVPLLKNIAASVGQTVHMVPVDSVLYFEAADKYLRVITAEREYLIRTALKELLPQLDPGAFWQVHRGTVVNTACLASVSRDEAGRLFLALRGRAEKLPVSRIYAHLFKAM